MFLSYTTITNLLYQIYGIQVCEQAENTIFPLYNKRIHMSTLTKIIILLLLVIVSSLLGFYYKNHEDESIQEHFTDATGTIIDDNSPSIRSVTRTTPYEIYDKFYASVYDELFRSSIREEFEAYTIDLYSIKQPGHQIPHHLKIDRNQIRFLDVGCGTGHHIESFQRKGYICDGVDSSEQMLRKARMNVKDMKGQWFHADVTQDDAARSVFLPTKYSHITCFFFTIYYIKDINAFFDHVFRALRPGGYFCVHLVHKKRFDPVLEKASSLIPTYNPQRHVGTRVTKTKLKFNKFQYIADWTIPSNDMHVTFREKFMFHTPSRKIRVNEHNFFMRNIAYYVRMAQGKGMNVVKVIDLVPTKHIHNYVYVMQKQ
jgi:SAM-dependent methyltransferase